MTLGRVESFKYLAHAEEYTWEPVSLFEVGIDILDARYQINKSRYIVYLYGLVTCHSTPHFPLGTHAELAT